MTGGRDGWRRGPRHERRCALLVAVIGTLGLVGAANAEQHAGAARSSALSPRVVEAQTCFRRSVERHAEGDLSGALVELKRAHHLAPNYKLLFNLGRISHEARDHAAAVDYFTRYLEEGADEVPGPRRAEVEADLTELKQRVGYIRTDAVGVGFEVIVDDLERGSTPLPGPLPLNVGRRSVELISPAGEKQVRVVEIAGGQTVAVEFKGRRPPPAMRRADAMTVLAAEPPRIGPAAAPVGVRAGEGADAPAARDDKQHSPSPSRSSLSSSRRWSPWVAWTLTALCAGATAVSGRMALSSAAELENVIDAYPVSPRELEAYAQRRREFALATDGFLLGTAVLSALSLYLTFSGGASTGRTGAKQLASASVF